MANEYEPSSSTPGALSTEDLGYLSSSLSAIVTGAFNEYTQWLSQYTSWAQMQLMNMQPIPPQANMEYMGRLNAIIQYLQRFQAPGEILAKAGTGELKQSVEAKTTELRKLSKMFQETQQNIASDNAATQQAIQNTWNQMGQENLRHGAARQNLRNETFTQNFEAYGETLANRTASFSSMNEKFLDALKDD